MITFEVSHSFLQKNDADIQNGALFSLNQLGA